MKFSQVLSVLMVVGSSFAVPNPLEDRALCKKPKCTAFCPDKTPYDCCVTYIRDPCTDHYCTSEVDFECTCTCPNGTKYLCNAQYFRDPCADIATE